MEVVETGLDANDARLYAMDATGVGLTVEEALGTTRPHENSMLGNGAIIESGFASCEVPPELMRSLIRQATKEECLSPLSDNAWGHDRVFDSHEKKAVPRGGYQGPDESYYAPPMYGDYNTFEMVRDHHYEQLHQELRQHRENEFNSPYFDAPMVTSSQTLSVGSNLLDKVFGKPWKTECEIIRQQSPYRDVEGWRLASFIIKAGEDIRKEALVMQIVSKLWTWFQAEIPPHLRPFLRPYTIMCVGGDAGLVECLPDVKSVNEVKKETDGFTSLLDFFQRAFRPVHPSIIPSPDTVSFEKARDNFLRSLVGYSVVCYILQIKDRHNANILMDREGHIMVRSTN
jgi:phosphatidylinositol 4-kinase